MTKEKIWSISPMLCGAHGTKQHLFLGHKSPLRSEFPGLRKCNRGSIQQRGAQLRIAPIANILVKLGSVSMIWLSLHDKRTLTQPVQLWISVVRPGKRLPGSTMNPSRRQLIDILAYQIAPIGSTKPTDTMKRRRLIGSLGSKFRCRSL